MSRRRGILLEIQGCPVAFTANETAKASLALHWVDDTEILEAQIGISPPQPMSVNFFDGTFEAGGISVHVNKHGNILKSRLGSPETYLTADVAYSDVVSMDANDVSGFPASGYIWIGKECVYYDGKTVGPPDSFDTLTRARYGTKAEDHSATIGTTAPAKNKVYGYNPKIFGRKVWIWWYDLDDPTSKTLIYIGLLDKIEFVGDGFQLSLTNGSKLIDDVECMAGRYAEGEFLGGYIQGSNSEYGKITVDWCANEFMLALANANYPFPDNTGYSAIRHIQIDDEIFSYGKQTNPAISGVALGVGTSLGRLYWESNTRFYRGDYVTFRDAVSVVQDGIITEEVAGGTYNFRYYHSAEANPGVGETISVPCRQKLARILRERFETLRADHDIGAKVQEVRILGEDMDGNGVGNHVDIVLALLTSTGTGRNGAYDILPTDWGARIDVDLIDIDAFEALADYVDYRRFIFTGPVKVKQILANLARVTGARIFFDETGKLTANKERDIYPDSSTIHSFVGADLQEKPHWETGIEYLYNCQVWRGNAPKGSDYKDEAYFEVAESVYLHGKRSMSDIEDPGLVLSRRGDRMEVTAVSILLRWSDLCPFLRLEVNLPNEGTVFQPGQLVDCSLLHLPDLMGGSGLSGTFEVSEYVPDAAAGKASILMAAMPPARNTGLIAPSAIVGSVSDPDVTLKSSADTHYADAANGWESDVNCLPAGEDGTEDVDYFKEGYAIRFWDVSTIGGANTSAAANITGVNYATRTITVDAVPAWLAQGDLVRLDQWDDVKAGTDPTPCDWYICLADETNDPPDIDGDEAQVWGL